MPKNKLHELLGAKNQEEAMETVKLMAIPPISITIVADATGGLSIGTSGNPSKELVERTLTRALKVVLPAFYVN
jgi:hypothetical protein